MNHALTTLLLIATPVLPLLLALPPLHRRLPWPLLLALLPAAALVLMPAHAWVALPWFREGAALGIDTASRWWLGMSLAVWACAYALLPAIDRVSGCTWLLLCLAGQLGTVLATDMVSFLSFATLMSYACIGLLLTERDPAGRRAGRRYLVLLIVADLLLFEAMLLAATTTEHLGFTTLAQAMAQSGSPTLYLALVVTGYLMKSGLWPLWWWLPRARRSPTPAQSLLLWVGPMATGLLGALRWLPLGEVQAPIPGMALLVAGAAIGLYTLRQGSWRASVRQPATALGCLTAAAVALAMGAGLMEPALWHPVDGWIPPLVAIAGVTLAIISTIDHGDHAAAHRPVSAPGHGGDRLVDGVQRVATHTLPKLRDAWFGYWREAWRRWPQALTATEQALRRWRLAVTLLLLLAIVMVALPLGAQS